ncbi:MAG: UvrD-helicase domain-containing protein [Clostridia bacterium]|nr:UvrD-helicase domain-containing protein [Clostridia bacterium]
MGERRWTPKQLEAIEARDRTLLVSAAAGSGKTATLTERIIRSLTDKENPIEVSELLVVTYTKAAASELRVKIARALENAVKENPKSESLSRQLYMLPSAKIRTIDSFCNDILRSNADRLGISAGYRIADGAELAILSKAILEGLIEAVYSGNEPEIATPEEFEELSDCLTTSKHTEELAGVFHLIWSRCSTAEDGIDALLPMIEIYDTEHFTTVEDTKYGAYLIGETKKMLEHYRFAIEKYRRAMNVSDKNEAKYYDLCTSDIDLIERAVSSSTYDAMRECMLGFKLAGAPAIRNYEKPADVEDYLAVRAMLRKDAEKFRDFYNYESAHWKALFETLHRLLSVLYRFEAKFDRVFLDEKIRRGAFGYDDIERFTYRLLISDGERTDVAKNLASQFSAIYIDEYQDVNSLQNKIFEAISRPDNRFMVGDIKQSIYGFRYARPEIFAAMKNEFPEYPDIKNGASAIFMANNFRCDEGVVNFVNGIFDKVFGLIGDSIGYAEGDRLVYSKIHETEPPIFNPSICMIDKDTELSEAEIVARKIRELLDSGTLDSGEAPRPSDIAIILRSAAGKYGVYSEALARLGIPSQVAEAKDFFLSAEVLLVLCLLNSIDNPRRDIYLAGLMCSPLFAFDADDLYLIRSECPESLSLYDALVEYTLRHPGYARGAEFISALSHYRAIAEGVGVDTLIYKLYYETGLMALASANGGKENLMLLYDYARGFEGGAFKGLYNFIAFINNLIDKNSTFDENRDADSADAVKIITCHGSKGLEYPIVFLSETGRAYSNKDARQPLAFDDTFGISFRTRTPSGLCSVESPVHDIINYYIKKKNFDEELRVLYVALTRAREQLYVTGVCPSVKREEYEARISVMRDNLTPYSVRTPASNLELMLLTAQNSRAVTAEELVGVISDGDLSDDAPTVEYLDGECERVEISVLSEELYKRFSYEYPDAHMTRLPEKMSVSRITPNVLDDNENETVSLFETDTEEKIGTLPSFMTGDSPRESARRGIATHYFMQFFDMDSLARLGAKEELSRLVREGFISPADAERVRIREIERFKDSRLFSDMRGARNIYREFRFNTEISARYFTEDEELREAYDGKSVLVQGVIDCIIEYEDGSIGLFDYKTDRLTKEECSDRMLAEERMRERHGQQLYYYSLAIERIFGKMPATVAVYSLAFGDTLDVKTPGKFAK